LGSLGHIGSPRGLRKSLFPRGFAAEVMGLIAKTWRRLVLGKKVQGETAITAVLRRALMAAYDEEGRDWFITLEDPLTDPEFGKETGRNDLNFYPPARYRNRQTVFFTVECKRLHVTTASGFKHKCDDYFVDGVQRFVDGRYSKGLPSGGMLGYVMDGQMDKAMSRVQSEALRRAAALQMGSPPRFSTPSKVLADHAWSADSVHDRADGAFALHHALVSYVARSRHTRGSGPVRSKRRSRRAA
jgi:hypothetical protein